jgi:5-formyltetrahydrofolate cyclo-ligase
MELKAQLRRRYRALRDVLSPEEVAEKSDRIREQLFMLREMRSASTVLTYASKANEVDTRRIIDQVLRDGRYVLVPVLLSQGELNWAVLTDLNDLEPGTFGVPEPRPGRRPLKRPPNDAPVLVPGLAFTPARYRLGHGGGYYDRFLAAHRGIRIGLAFDLQIVPELPLESHDVRLDFVITETKLFGPETGE